MAEKQTLYIIDGHAQIYRAYYAPFRDLTAPSGEPTKATYVFCSMLLSLIADRRPDYLAMAMDVPTDTLVRREVDSEYKAHRQPMPEDLPPQIDRITAIVAALGIPTLSVPRFEADDVMATIAHRARTDHPELDVYLVSRDKDLDQVLADGIYMYDPSKGEVINAVSLEATKGYTAAEAVEIQALTGDTTDNIKGVQGVGPKTAVKLIKKYATAEAVIAAANEQTPKLKANLHAFADKLAITRALVTLRTDVPVELDLPAWRFVGIDADAVRPIFTELGFTRLIDQIDRAGSGGAAPSATVVPADGLATADGADYRLVDTVEALENLAVELRKAGSFAFDTETTALNPVAADLVGLSFSWQPRTGYYVPVRSAMGQTVDVAEVRRILGPVLADPTIVKCGQNVKYDMVVLRRAGFEVAGVDFDTLIASFLLDPTRRSHGLDALAEEELGYRTIKLVELIGRGKKQITIDQVDPAKVCEYAAEDADVTWQLRQMFEPRLTEGGFDALFAETEMPLVEVLAEMEINGVAIDTDHLATLSNGMADRLKDLTGCIHAEAGHEFNIDSTRQLAQVLFDEQGLRVVRKTKTARSTDADTLATLAAETNHPLPGVILQYRELTKLKNTYVDPLPEMVCPKTGRIHTSFNPTGAITGRLSSSDPNLQNIPIRSEQGREIRRAFVPGCDDHVLLTADYSQIELRVMAHFCQDDTLLTAFRKDQDIHTFVAAQIFGVELGEVTSDQRGRAKAVNFGIIYGQTAYGLSRTLGIPVGEADAFIRTYYLRYPGIQMFVDACVAKARKHGYVETILGRRRPIEEINSRNANRRAMGERLAVNTVIQGSAADLIKRAMIHLHHRIQDEHLPLRMLIQVHDELVFETPADAADRAADVVREEMIIAMKLDVPVKVDIGVGPNWLESK